MLFQFRLLFFLDFKKSKLKKEKSHPMASYSLPYGSSTGLEPLDPLPRALLLEVTKQLIARVDCLSLCGSALNGDETHFASEFHL